MSSSSGRPVRLPAAPATVPSAGGPGTRTLIAAALAVAIMVGVGVPGSAAAVTPPAALQVEGSHGPSPAAPPVSAPETERSVPAERTTSVPRRTSVLHGTVRAPGLRSDTLLPGAFIEVRQNGTTRTSVSDPQGRYRIEGLAAGPARVSVHHIAARPLGLEVRLPSDAELVLDLELEPRALPMAALEVRALPAAASAPVEKPVARDPVRFVRGVRGLDASTGMVEAGLARALARPPGEEEPAPDRVLFMRGSTVDTRTVLLDGIPILTPFHVAGLVPAFEADLLGEAHLYLGGAPSRYEGGLSYLLDVGTRSPGPRGARGRLALDGVLWTGSAEVPLPGGGGGLIAGRSLHGMQEKVLSGNDFPYLYSDFLLRWSLPLGGGHHVGFTGFRNEEGVRLDEVLLDGGQARWGNRATSVRYNGRFGRVAVAALAARSHYESSLPLAWADPVLARASSDRNRAALDLLVPADGWRLHLGASMDRTDYAYQLDPRGEFRSTLMAGGVTGMGVTSVGGYAEASIPVGDRVDLRGGIRAEHFSNAEGIRMGPRGSVRTSLTEKAILTVSAGRYHQPMPLPGLIASGLDSEEAARLNWDPYLPIASSTHLVLALDQLLDERLHLGVSGFVKGFEGLEGPGGARVSASGTDLRVFRGGERLDGWIGYSLSWFWEAASTSRSSTFSGRHLVSIGAKGQLREGVEFGVTAGYGAGLPLTSVGLTGAQTPTGDFQTEEQRRAGNMVVQGVKRINTASGGVAPLDFAPEDDFLRLDLELTWTTQPSFAGRSTQLRPYVRVLNALDSRDALFHYLDHWREGEMHPVARRPFLPIVGMEWRF